jgi:hypothetical protein
LTWSASGATSYDVRFGATNPPPLAVSGASSASYTLTALANGRKYYWQIVARNGAGTASGPVWSFTTVAVSQRPGTPTSPSPVAGATGVSTRATLSWSASGATSYDVRFGTTNTPPKVVTAQTSTSYAPSMAAGKTYFWQIVARNSAGTTTGPLWSFSTSAAVAPIPEVVIYASDIPAAARHGSWSSATDPTSPNGTKLVTTDNGWATANNPLASPADYIDVTFAADANTGYTIWLRLKALNNSKYNDSVWVQFSDALVGGSQVYPMNTTSGLVVNLATDVGASSVNSWGWENTAYWLSQPVTVAFAPGGTHTMRIQVREDGVQLDQIVLSSARYLTSAPGSVTNDQTIVPK